MKKLMSLSLILLTVTAYGMAEKRMSPEDQAELTSIMKAYKLCMKTKKELITTVKGRYNHQLNSPDSVPKHFKTGDNNPSPALNNTCELLARQYTALIAGAYQSETVGGLK
jgi:hypothetical protein